MKHYGIPVVHKDYIPEDLPDNTEADYRSHHKVWKSILDSSIHPGAKRFRNYLMGRLGTVKKNGQKKELNTEVVSRNIAFAIVMFQNSKRGREVEELDMVVFNTAQDVTKALSETKCIEDPDILTDV